MIHFNLRSLQKNIDKLSDYLAGFKNQPEIIAISETKLREGYTNRNIELEGYTFLHSDSRTQAGGVGIYIKNSLQCSINQCTKICIAKAEHLWVDISTNQRPVTVSVVYRHPDDSATAIDKFNEEFKELLVLLNNTKCPFYCLGDFNVNLLNVPKPNKDAVRKYANMLLSCNSQCLIDVPNRVTSISRTLLDHI